MTKVYIPVICLIEKYTYPFQHKTKILQKYPQPYYTGITINLIIILVRLKSRYMLNEVTPLATCDNKLDECTQSAVVLACYSVRKTVSCLH